MPSGSMVAHDRKHFHYYWPHRMLLLVGVCYLDAPNKKYMIQLISLYQWFLCQSLTSWVQASAGQDH